MGLFFPANPSFSPCLFLFIIKNTGNSQDKLLLYKYVVNHDNECHWGKTF